MAAEARGVTIPELDGLRALAIIMVLMCHVWGKVGTGPVLLGPLDLTPLANMGAVGVQLFFVLSGYFLFPSVIKFIRMGKIRSYFYRRFFRIVPAYYLTILAVYLFSHTQLRTIDILSHLLFVHTLSADTFWTVSGVFWSLGPEIQFYIFLPFLIYIFSRLFSFNDHKKLLLFLSSLVITSIVFALL